jgi:hypothetical protein
MYLRGNVGLGKRVMVHLGGSGTDVEGCLSLELHWQAPAVKGNAKGELTGLGRNFTPGGLVDVKFDFLQAGAPGPQRGQVEPSGQFAIPLPGNPRVMIDCDPGGVDILAFDLNSGETLEFNFPIPCLT